MAAQSQNDIDGLFLFADLQFGERHRIQKVPQTLRLDNGDREYDPLVVSLGPYHHGKEELQLAENFKQKALEMFVADSGKNVQFFYTQVLEQVNFCRSCYFQDSTSAYDDPTFAHMMLLDACFIINFIVSLVSWLPYRITIAFLGESVFHRILGDLFLLENQLPFRLLQLLTCLRYGHESGEELLNDFMYTTLFQKHMKRSGLACGDHDKPYHLLDAWWLILVSRHGKEKKFLFPYELGWLKSIGNISRCSHVYYNCIAKFPWLTRGKKDDHQQDRRTSVFSFRSATALKAKGIHLRPSSFASVRCIKFKPGWFFPKLEVPVWFVSTYTKGFFLNMIAYELSLNPTADRTVTAYIEFMKSLINNTADVEELREKSIFLSTLGRDEEVVDLFREIKTYDPSTVYLYSDVKRKIKEHCNSRVKAWVTEFLRNHCWSPWKAIGLIAATFLLILTFLQTYYTIVNSPGNK